MKKNKLAILISITSGLGLAGCNDSNSSTETAPPLTSTYSVTAIDGYLQNAQVWLDLNGNFQLDANEPNTLSGVGGIANLDVSGITNPEQYPVVVKAIKDQTIDEDQGVVTTNYVMSAPAGETAVTPLSTMVHVILKQSTTELDSDEEVAAKKQKAIQQVSQQLGIEAEDVMGDFIDAGNDDVVYAAENIVASNVLPSTPEQLEQISDKNNSDSTSFTKVVEAVSNTIKQNVVTIKADDSKEFVDAAPVFTEEDNFDTDTDNDGIADVFDIFPDDINEWVNFDGDDEGDNADLDDDNDLIADIDDAFPLDSTESIDSDNDGFGNNADTDDDNDGVLDTVDAFPLNNAESVDTDEDGTGNNADTDDDNDDVPDSLDMFPLDNTESIDTDLDRIGNNADTDDDNDAVLDNADEFPLDNTESVDTDKDGTGNNKDNDDDGDGVNDDSDSFPLDGTESIDTDNDGTGNNEDVDDDDDGVNDDSDAFPLDGTESVDTDNDGTGNNADDDDDGVNDDDDTNPLNPEIGLSENAEVIHFLRDSDTFYSIWEDNNDDNISELFVETFTVNGDIAPMTALQQVTPDNSLINIPTDSDADLQLTSSGWEMIPDEFTIDFSDGKFTAYPTGHSELSQSITSSLIDLTGKNIAENGMGWSLFADDAAVYPEGSTAAVIKFTPNNDSYLLWDWQAHVFTGNSGIGDGEVATLDALISDVSAGQNPEMGSLHAVSISYNTAVELVDGGIANYYTLDFQYEGKATLVGTSTWTRSIINDEDIIVHTVPQSAIDAFGDDWHQDTQDMIFSAHNETVLLGSLEKAGIQIKDDEGILLNETAKTALLANAIIPLDTDGDNIDNRIDTDDDNDGLSDVVEADQGTNPLLPDTDGDGDGVDDFNDAFPINGSETLDTDNDGTGNNADTDDDGDGVDDTVDIDPLNPSVGLPENSQVINFLRDSGTFYSVWEDDDYDDISELFVETFTTSNDIAPMSALHKLTSENSLVEVDTSLNADLELTTSGWLLISEEFTIDFSDGQFIAYPTGHNDLSQTITSSLVDLSGKNIAENGMGWSLFADDSAVYPEGSTAAVLKFTQSSDSYFLWDWQAYVHNSDNGNVATLDELVADVSAGLNPVTGDLHAVSIGYDIAVELVDGEDGRIANYYTLDYKDTGRATLVGSSTWSRSTIHGEDIIVHTVPQNAINAFGDKWEQDTPDMIFSVHNETVSIGSLEKAGIQIEDDEGILLNETAKTALLDQAIACDVSNASSLEGFKAIIDACYADLPVFDSSTMTDMSMSHVNNNGETRAYTFNENETGSYYRNGIERAITWSFDNDGLLELASEDGSVVTDKIALIENMDNEFEFAIYAVEESEAWESTYTNTTYQQEVYECAIDNTEWDDVNDEPLTLAPYSQFISAVINCNAQTDNPARFSSAYFDRTFSLVSGDSNFQEIIKFTVDDVTPLSGIGTYTDGDVVMNTAWKIDDVTNIITLEVFENDALVAVDYMSVVETNGVQFSIKTMSQSPEWDGIGLDQKGDIWSNVFTIEEPND